MGYIADILGKETLERDDIILLLQSNVDDRNKLYSKAAEVKAKYVGKRVYFRGLIEMSNICYKNCYYCGIRTGNTNLKRFNLSDDEVVEAAVFAWQNNYANIAIQTGEAESPIFTERVSNLLNKINKITNNELGITLAMGEQSEDTLRQWFENGAIRYFLRIEASSRELYSKLHPNNKAHSFDKRIESLKSLRRIGYQVGTGVLVGLPYQTIEHLADDLLWIKKMDIDMVGMETYVEHPNTPLYKFKDLLLPLEERFNLSLKMISILRILMKDINIAAPIAPKAIDKLGREKGIMAGANVVMPNITPDLFQNDYSLIDNNSCNNHVADECANCLEARIELTGDSIGFGEHGNSMHYIARNNN
jgi:biotin synthase